LSFERSVNREERLDDDCVSTIIKLLQTNTTITSFQIFSVPLEFHQFLDIINSLPTFPTLQTLVLKNITLNTSLLKTEEQMQLFQNTCDSLNQTSVLTNLITDCFSYDDGIVIKGILQKLTKKRNYERFVVNKAKK